MPMQLEFGNLGSLDTEGTGWFLGYGAWTRPPAADGDALRFLAADAHCHGLQAKWMAHPAGDPRGSDKPLSVGRTLSILVSEGGRFRLEFSPDPGFEPSQTRVHTLKRHGDYALWGPGLHHRWQVEEACVVFTLRWQPAAGG